MRRVIAIAVAGATLGGCSSFPSLSWDAFKSAPATVQVQLESVPPGADAVTSVGPGCKTPCSVSVAAPDSGFSVTFNMPKFQPATVRVTVVHNPGDLTTAASTVLDPNPVVAELQPESPPPRARKPRPKRPKPAAAAAPAAEPAAAATAATAAGSAFPDPNAATQR